jgi:hypothetical protein
MTLTKKAPAIGTRVGVRYGGSTVRAVIIEDRGVLGTDHIVRVHVGDWDDPEAPEFEVPVDELLPEPAAA